MKLGEAFVQLQESQDLDGNNFGPTVKRYLDLHPDLTGLRHLRDKAANERNMRELYRGRAFYELLQNADDAGATRAVFILTNDGLGFAHDGRWFSIGNFKSLADCWSDKDPGQCIGHKGIGFRSVLDVTPSPHVIRVANGDFFGFKFSWATNHNFIKQTIGSDLELKREYDSWTKSGRLACPVMAIPGRVKRGGSSTPDALVTLAAAGKLGDPLTTLFWLPARDPDINPQALEQLGTAPITSDPSGVKRVEEFLRGDVRVLLPFLSSVQSVALHDGKRQLARAFTEVRKDRHLTREITVWYEAGRTRHERRFFQLTLDEKIPLQVKQGDQTPNALKQMDRAGLCLSVELEGGQPKYNADSPFHVYLPTQEGTGLGLVVHGDFHVKPDRTSLMEGQYNDWLLDKAGRHLAGGFLTALLEHYEPRCVYEALRPRRGDASPRSKTLLDAFAKALRARKVPFIQSRGGLANAENVVLPPAPDPAGFWAQHFGDLDNAELPKTDDFLHPDSDSESARGFFEFAGVRPVRIERVIDYIESAGADGRQASWWYKCYEFLARNPQSMHWEANDFASRRVIPVSGGKVVQVNHSATAGVCLPLSGSMGFETPPLFQNVLSLMDGEVARLLQSGSDEVRSWILQRFGIARFEATDVLPRAVRSVVVDIMSGSRRVTQEELVQAWAFAFRMVGGATREITSADFWSELGRLPVPFTALPDGDDADREERANALPVEVLAPAALTYWPDSRLPNGTSCIQGVAGLRRLSASFLDQFESDAEVGRPQARDFWQRLGVADSPRLLVYRRMPAERASPVVQVGAKPKPVEGFYGMTQVDVNRAVTQVLAHSPAWTLFSHGLPLRPGSSVLHTLAVLEGFSEVVAEAHCEMKIDEAIAIQRLRRLWRALAGMVVHGHQNTAFNTASNAAFTVTSFVDLQLDSEQWLPTTCGPAARGQAFYRFKLRRLISRERDGTEIGDQLIPYVLANSEDECAELRDVGVQALEGVESADIPTLVRALTVLGARLAEPDARNTVIEVRARWRLVRGAIQEIYRQLNQPGVLSIANALQLAVHRAGRTEFVSAPWYFAPPGSSAEKAFQDDLPMLDVDRRYPKLFSDLGVREMNRDNGLNEEFVAEDRAAPSAGLKASIVNELGPYLVAVIAAKSEEQGHRELVLKRLRERLTVKTADDLKVSVTFQAEEALERCISYGQFYMNREVRPGQGAAQEAVFTLYVKGAHDVTLRELDGDALGQALVPLFAGQASRELEGLIPRVVSRYQQDSSPEQMRRFLHEQLGISVETQLEAEEDVSDQDAAIEEPEPPPPLVVKPLAPHATGDDQLGAQRDSLFKDINALFAGLGQRDAGITKSDSDGVGNSEVNGAGDRSEEAGDPGGPGPRDGRRRNGGPSSEQQARGRRGEEEFLRRVRRSGGWAGFGLIEDRRAPGYGFDFLCCYEGRDVGVEVKTFSSDGRVVVSATELGAAAAYRGDYFLIGFLDDGSPEAQWHTGILRNPLSTLVAVGKWSIETKLQAVAKHLFKALVPSRSE